MSKEKKKTKKEQVEETKEEVKKETAESSQSEEAEEEKAEEKKEPSKEEKLEAELKDQKDKYMRLCAEYDNYRKRTASEKAAIYDDATARAVTEILPIADSVTMALSQFEGKEVPEEFSKGIALIAQQLQKSFEKLSIEVFGEVGDEFDPNLHNAISSVENDELPENSIAAVYQKGYKVKDKIIRHAMVQVANT